jgi:hypothetical protein
MRALILVAFAVGGCSSDGLDVERAELASLSFNVPAGWERVDRQSPRVVTAEWRPQENERKESLVVKRSSAHATAATANTEDLERLLLKSHSTTRNLTPAIRFSTPEGLAGVRVEFDFRPGNSTQTYHRVHAVLRDRDSIIHVLYTARTPDSALADLLSCAPSA